MPLYKFVCRCGAEREAILPSWKSPNPRCPACKMSRMRRAPTSAAVKFKGAGFFANEYPKEGRHGTHD